jgi:UDP-N-acetylmuramate dehydrogenase
LNQRAATQPIGLHSCGSVFRNPPGDHAARLIESCGLKGARVGGAHVSDKHANFIINDARAGAGDIEALIVYVQQQVAERTGVMLEPEVVIAGGEAE